MLWDLFCRVVDNHGDLGVCWRLAADLASRGESVRLALDDASALAWMAPQGARGVDLLAFDNCSREPGDVVVEAFGCELPASFVARMQRPRPPLWINLEYLSAETYVERSHALPSPQSAGPGAGLRKWFYYPGFTNRTGGLLRERGLIERRLAFDRDGWLAAQRLAPRTGERVVGLFCYQNPALAAMLDALSLEPTLLLVAAGVATRAVQATLGASLRRARLRAHLLPYLSQPDFDHLLWSCELNFVRGEDSFVRAQWAGAPFAWQAYPQGDAAHKPKLDAFLAQHLAGAPTLLARAIQAHWQAWNGFGPWPGAWPDTEAWRSHTESWREKLLRQPDLATCLLGFVLERA